MEEPLLSLVPKNDSERLLWERLKVKTLEEELKKVSLELGYLKSEFDEYRYYAEKDEEFRELIIKNKAKSNSERDLKKENKRLRRENLSMLGKYVINKTKEYE